MRREDGFTVIELLVAATLMVVILGATLTTIERFQRHSNRTAAQNDSQESARVAINKIARELRNGASPAEGSTIGIGRVLGDDFVFQAVDDTGTSGGANVRRAHWVRYCLDSSTPANGKLWRQTFAWTSATAPAIPFGTTCPDSTVGTKTVLTGNVVNAESPPATAVFSFDPQPPANPSATDLSQITHVQVDLLINTDAKRNPKATRLTTGVYLRNQSTPPVARFDQPSASGSGRVYLNGSPSTDPLGSSLTYQWCDTTGGAACTASTAIGQGVTMQYDSPSGTRSITLVVTNESGQSDSATQEVTVP
jgi:type II secretory pathway pseudopilin PulG